MLSNSSKQSKKPKQRVKEAEEGQYRDRHGLLPVGGNDLTHTTVATTISNQTPLVSSKEAIERMEEQRKNRAAQLAYRDSEDLGDHKNTPTGPKASGANAIIEVHENNRLVVKRREQATKQTRIVRAAKSRLMQNCHQFEGVKELMKKDLKATLMLAEARTRVQPILSAMADLEAAMQKSSDNGTDR